MSISRFIVLSLLTALVFYAVTQLPQNPASSPTALPGLLFPALSDKLDAVQQLTVQTSAQTFHIARQANGWQLLEKANYPVDTATINALLFDLADLRPLEAKTSSPELHAQLRLLDPEQYPGQGGQGTALKLSLQDAQQQSIASRLIGKTSPNQGESGRFAVYVRKPESAQTWLAVSNVQVESDPLAWVERSLLALDRQRIRQVTLQAADGSSFSLQRNTPEDKDYTLTPMPTGATLKSAGALSLLLLQAANLKLDDIQAAPTEFQAVERYTLDTFDGLQVQAELAPHGNDFLLQLKAEAVAAQLAEIQPPFLPQAEITASIAQLNARWQNWVYVISPMTHAAVFQPLTELLNLATPQPTATEPAAALPETPAPETLATPADAAPVSDPTIPASTAPTDAVPADAVPPSDHSAVPASTAPTDAVSADAPPTAAAPALPLLEVMPASIVAPTP